ncbi:competence type IV pilus minor pilin ComGF [Salibacterium halotolerans]|uniref:Prepilin-type N-terminal cleavage/methylation domain-containing protein n=1 Tax=Salibacterium halotolerans TaxID=1884432 RepID=A0A1I5NL25_9BACI|nr:competence type IV pilus minor pilin ComGF [Salibacterium halotolerans]SFP22505.1 prepilin-type N-terminal cleavage/methylation domain-containing protein [Salibacterium halotolerans]
MNVLMKNVCFSSRNQRGMTLMELLLSLTILFVCTAVLVQVLPLWEKREATSKQEIQLFFQQLKEDMNYAFDLETKQNALILKEYRNERKYSLSRGRIIRTTNETGYEIVLQDVRGFSAARTPYGADVSVMDKQGVTWSGVIGKRPLTEKGNAFWVKREP